MIRYTRGNLLEADVEALTTAIPKGLGGLAANHARRGTEAAVKVVVRQQVQTTDVQAVGNGLEQHIGIFEGVGGAVHHHANAAFPMGPQTMSTKCQTQAALAQVDSGEAVFTAAHTSQNVARTRDHLGLRQAGNQAQHHTRRHCMQ